MFKKLHLVIALMMLVASSAMAQLTTSSLAGKVTAEGEDVIGAAIEALHTPSGTRYRAVTNNSGLFTINGMRVGGPYEVKISYVGYKTLVNKDITLQLGETYRLNAVMSTDEQLLDEIVVTGKSTDLMVERTGASTNITADQIINMPTVSRSITDITRLSPYGGNGMSFAGGNGKMSNFTVDGANFNNNFGLSDNLPGGGNPISIEAIEEMQVVISPYDVRQTNFIGGGVNAITKSGTNTFKGSAYVYHQNENMRGDAVDRQQIAGARERDSKTTYGFTLGGPIIKDKLFFFVNGEAVNIPSVANRWRASDDGVADPDNYVSRTTNYDLQRVSDHVMQKYGYDTGSWSDFPADESNYKLLARIDWNITDKHHLSARYNFTKNRYWNTPSATSVNGGPSMSGARSSQYSMVYANSMYAMDNLVHSFSLDLNSRLTDNLSNQFLVTLSKLDDVRDSESSEFPFIDILKDNQSYISLGYELFTWNNAVNNTVWTIKDDVTYYAGNHKITAGVNYEYQMAENIYMRFGSGYYRYKSVDDFINGATPEIVNLTYGYNGESAPGVRVQYNKVGVYAQDEWDITPKFKLTYGLRLDGLFFNDDDLMTNKAIYDIDYNGRHIDTGKWPSNNISISPRIGFSWDVLGDKSLKIRGGSGLFSGRLPLVFFTNMPSNSGMKQYQAYINASAAAKKGFTMDEFAGGLVTDANGKPTAAALLNKLASLGYPTTITPEEGTAPSSISAVDPDFKMPQVWKTSLAVDYDVPVGFPLTITAEGIFNKTINGVCLSDWSMKGVGGFSRPNGADNRPLFPADFRDPYESAFMLENTSKGYGWTANLTINARPTEWLSLMAAYTHTVQKEITGMPGSNAESAFRYVPSVEGPNNLKLHNSEFVTPDRFILAANIKDKSNNHFNIVYEAWRGGSSYSYMLSNDMNGDGYNYDALYIPTDKEVMTGQFRFKTNDDRDRFMAYLHNNDYLKDHQGEYAEPYSEYSPWVHRVDIGYKHDFKLNVGKTTHTLQLSLDVKNVLNLFNSGWGVSKYMNPDLNSGRILKYEGVDADGYATFSTPSAVNGNTKTWVKNHAIGQCWYASVGIKYIFN